MAELLIKNALVVDGSGSPGFRADVAVIGDRIAAVGDLAGRSGMAAERVIDAAGRVLCPGFVDAHGHSDYYLLVLPTADGKLRQGITTEVGGNCGYSAAPVAGEVEKDRRQSHRELYGLELDFTSFEQYLSRLARERPAINFAPLVGFNTARGSAGLFSSEPARPEQLAVMTAMIRDSMEAGAFGLSLGLIYPPGAFAGLPELVACAREVAAKGGVVSSHMRSEGDRLIEAVRESLAIARGSGAAFQISHLKTSGNPNWGKLAEVFRLVEEARAEGHRVTADRYPYLASFTQLSAALPEWVAEGGKEAFFARLSDPAVRERARRELAQTDPLRDRWDRIVISVVFDDELARYEGKSVAAAAAEANMDPVDFVCETVVKVKDRAAATYHTMSTGNLELILQKDWVMAGTDAAVRTVDGRLSEGKPHPRAYGTMPRMIAWAVRQKKWLSLETAIRKMTSDPCAAFGITGRGLIREGMFADLVLFDPARIKDHADYDNPKQYSTGLDLVTVNGKIAVENDSLTGKRAGRVLRKGGGG